MFASGAARRKISSIDAASHWELRKRPKYASHGVVRATPPAETIENITPLMPTVGVTRIAEVTHLDRVGIPNFVTVRPRDVKGISYYNGKGATRNAAKAGAMMEAIERYSGELCDLEVSYGTLSEMRKLGAAVDPNDLIVPRFREYHRNLRLEWVAGFDLIARKKVFVPLNSVVQPYEPARGRLLYYSSTNGLASGNNLEEAICHGLCEVIERDADAISAVTRDLAPAVNRVLEALGVSAPPTPLGQTYPLIALDTLPIPATRLVRKLQSANLLVYLRSLTCTARIPTFECTIVETQPDGKHAAHGGSGTHPDSRVAVSRAITEAAQSRVGCIQGGREDLPHIMKEKVAFDPDAVFGRGPFCSFGDIQTFEHPTIDGDIKFILSQLKAEGLDQVIAVDLTRPELGVPVVKIIIPNAENWTVFYMHVERAMFGPRVKKLLKGAPLPPRRGVINSAALALHNQGLSKLKANGSNGK